MGNATRNVNPIKKNKRMLQLSQDTSKQVQYEPPRTINEDAPDTTDHLDLMLSKMKKYRNKPKIKPDECETLS